MHGVRASTLAVCLLLFGVATGFSSGRARAQSPDPATSPASRSRVAPPGYEAAADLGFQEFESGHYAEARARFLEAHRLWPNARVLRALGYCEFELEHYVAAVEFLQQTLASTVRPLTEAQRRETEALLARARSYVARCTVQTVPRDARVLIDGVDALPDATGALLLAAGRHIIEVHAPGYQVGRRELSITGTVNRVVQMSLKPLPPARRAAQRARRLSP